ncbi:hydroxymethylglutaryl-CoA synthase [Streptomyces beigongshangae]|uniref:hydroxymethylglutaryl-CoA synthase n=1 Tax=Streptomyces beigongshangae TaxID=2841597 RepID=UPI001C84E2A7|nr:hydroxymethylglutaryl-CoA synthase [Streptomyces sp. REN17]
MSTDLPVGIHDLTFATTSLVLTHDELARHTGANPSKYHYGIGQRAMSIPAVDEDIVTLAAEAAAPLVDRHGGDTIRTLLLATESGIDQSKAAGIYVHRLLGLHSGVRVVELKQACYGATAALQLACALVRTDPTQRILVLASDIARYDLDSPGEATQGAAAAAMLVGAHPALATVDAVSGLFTQDIMDFWRPNYRATPLVDGKKSLDAYLHALDGAWHDHQSRHGLPLEKLRAVCYHQPFTRMAHKAHHRLLYTNGAQPTPETVQQAVAPTTTYNELVGNSYTASLYLALAALLDSDTPLEGETVGLFSYGSGSVAEFLTATVQPRYRSTLHTWAHQKALATRTALTYPTYLDLHSEQLPQDGHTYRTPHQTRGRYRLAGIDAHQRIYETTTG